MLNVRALRHYVFATRAIFFAAAFIFLNACTGGSSSQESISSGGLGLKLVKMSGDNQVTTPSASWSQPLVVRVVEGNTGLPSIPVTFADTSATGASVVNTSVLTDSEGYARTSAVAPAASNLSVKITASLADNSSVVFNLETRSFPDTPVITLRDPVTLSTAYAQQTNLDLSITTVPTAVRWCVSESMSSRPNDGSQNCVGGSGPFSGWSTSKPTSFNLSSVNGAKSLYVWVADQYNQVNLFPSSATIFLDTMAPSVPIVTLSDVNSGSITDTSDQAVNFTVSNDGDASYWCIFPQMWNDAMPATPTRNAGCWVNSKPTLLNLVALGLNRVSVWTKDLAGNVSPGAGQQFINYTTLTIADPAFTLKDQNTASQVYSRGVTVDIGITGDSTATKWCVSEQQSSRPTNSLQACTGGAGLLNGWSNSRPTTFTLSGGDGLKTVYVWVANALNNTNGNIVSRTITVDTVAPAIPLADLTDPNTGQPNFTNQSTVNLSITGDTDAVAWCKYEKSSLAAPPSLPAFNDVCWVGARPTTVALGATGARRVYIYTKDSAQNVSPAPAVAMITYTTTAPASPVGVLRDPETNSTTLAKNQTVNLSINSPAGTVRWCVSETQASAPATGTSTCNGGVGASSGWHTSAPTTFALSSGDGAKTVYLWVADGANNVNATTATAAITLDLTPPALPVVTITDPNSGSPDETNQIIATLGITGDTDAVRWCRIVQDVVDPAPATPNLTDVCWAVSRPNTVVLEQPGTRKLYLFTRDAAGNVGTPGAAEIVYSTGVPSDPTIILSDINTSLTTYANQLSVGLNISNDTGAVKWCVSETQSTRPLLGTAACSGGLGSANGWSTAKPTTWTLSASDGVKRVYVWTANTANSVNNNPASGGLTLDRVKPSTPAVALRDPNTNSTSDTNQSTVSLAISGEDADVTAWCVLEQAAATAAPSVPSWNNACWTTSKPVTATLSATGSRKVYVYFRDLAYNVSLSAGQATMAYSTSAPNTPSLAVTDGTTGSTTYARQVAVAVSITGDGGAVKWCVSESQSTQPTLGTSNCVGGAGSANGWHTTRPTSINISSGDAAKTIYLWTANAANNTSSAVVSDAITLDTLPPSVPFVTLSDSLTSSTTVTNQANAGLSIQFDTDAVKWCVIEQSFATAVPAQPLFNNGCWVGTRPTAQTLGATGIRRVFVYTQDVAMNVTPAAAVAQINYTTTPPTDPALTLTNSTTGSTTVTRDLAVTPSITSPTGTIKWCLSETQTTRPTSGSAACNGGAGPSSGWYTSLPNSFTLSGGDAVKSVYIWVADTNNNVNANVATGTITLDTDPPAMPTVVMSDPNNGSTTQTNQFTVDLAITVDTDAVRWCPIMQAAAAAAPSSPALNDSCWRTSRPTQQLVDATGSRKLYVFTRDSAANVGSPGVATIDYSILPPADPSLTVADATTALSDFAKGQSLNIAITADTGAVKWCVSEAQSTRPPLGTATCNGGSGASNGWYTSRPTTFALSSGEALKRVYVWTSDVYNNVNANPTSASITLDTSPPAAPAVSLLDPNTGSSTQTNQSGVNLNIGATADALAWCVIEQASASAAPAAPAFNNGCFHLSKPTTQTLGALGGRTVYVYTRDRAYNVASSAGTAVINYSTTAPSTATLALSDGVTGSTAYVRQSATTIAITGDTGAVRWCVSEAQTTRPTLGTSSCSGGAGPNNGWYTTRPTSFAVSSGEGAKSIYVWTADLANNTSGTAGTDSITLDTVTPAIPTVSLSDPNTNGTAFTNQSTVNLTITQDTDAVAWCVMEQASASAAPTAPLFDNGCWVGSRPTTTTLAAQGNRRVYVYTKDAAANVSLASSIASIAYSTSAPSDPVLVLSNSVTGSRTYTGDRNVAVSINNPVGAVRWCISETQATRPATGTATCTGGAGPSSGWYDSMPSTFQLSTGDATKTVYIWVADNANNTNANASSTSIILLQVPPDPPTVALNDPNTNSSAYTNQSSVNMAITGDTAASAWCALAQDAALAAPAQPASSSTCWVLTRPVSVPLGATGSRKVYVFLRDAAMNISSPGHATIALTTTSPGDPSLALTHAVTGLSNYARTTALSLAITADSTATRWCVSETQSVKPLLGTSTCAGGSGSSSGWHTTRPTSFTLSSGDGLKRVYVWVADASNNTNDNAISQTITLDTQPPGSYTVTGLTGASDITPDAWLGTTVIPTVSWAAASGASSYTVEIKNATGSATVCAAETTAATTYNFSGCNLVDGTSYRVYLSAADEAQNTATASNSPFTFVVKLTPPGAFSISGVTGSQDTTADQWGGSSLPTVSWTASASVNSYIVRILANDGVTVMCPQQVKSAGTLSHEYSTTGCSALTDNTLYQVEVVAQDVAGNIQTASNNLFLFRTDLTAPNVSISGNPAAQAITAAANFTFSGSDNISGIAAMQCKLDSGSFAACDTLTTHAYSVADGSHSFTVRAADKVGLTQTATYSWQVDTVLPNAFTITGATGPTDSVVDGQLQNDTTMTANWTTSSNAADYEVSILNSDDSVACAPVIKAAGSNSHHFSGCTLVNPGSYKIKVVARRGYGTTYAPTPMAISAVKDSVTAVITASSGTVSSGSSVTITLVGYQNSVQMSSNVLNPSFAVGTGTSTGTFGSVSYIGSGTYTVSFTGVLAGTVSQVSATSAYLSGFTGQTPASITVIPGGVSAAVSTITLDKSTVQADNADLVTISVGVKDAAGNPIKGATIGSATSGGLSTGAFSSFTETPANSGTYVGTFLGHTSGTATSLQITADGTLLNAHPTIQVLPGPPVKVSATGPANISTHQCSGPYTVTLRDHWNNLASALSNVRLDFGGLTLGNFSLATDCATSADRADIFLGGSTAPPVYVMPRAPSVSASFTFEDHAHVLATGAVTVTVNGTLAWLGTSGQLNWGPAIGLTTKSSLYGLQEPRGIWINTSTNTMYIADTSNHRIVRYNMTTKAQTGWIGRVDSTNGISCPSTAATGAAAPGWCTGGSSQVSAGTNWDGMFNNPTEITGDGTYLYISDASNHRIARVQESTGEWKGWYGRISVATSMTCVGGGAAVAASATPNWCYAGTSAAATGTNWDGMFNLGTSATLRSFYDAPTASNLILVIDNGNHRVVRLRVNSSDVIWEGWAGRSASTGLTDGENSSGCSGVGIGDATTGWCRGGNSQAAPVASTPTVSNYDNMFNNPRGLAIIPGTPSMAYFGDLTNGRFVELNVTTGKTNAWAGRPTNHFPGSGGTNCGTYNTDTGWCTGGVPIYNAYCYPSCGGSNTANRNTYASNLIALDTDGTYLYGTFSATNLYAIYRFPLSSPFAPSTNIRWVGRINGTPTLGAGCSTTPLGFPTPGWCGGGTSRIGYADGQFSQPWALSINNNNGLIYTVDRNNSKVQMHDLTTGESMGFIAAQANASPATWSTTYVPGLQGNINVPGEDLSFATGYSGGTAVTAMWGITSDGTNLFVSDTGNYRVKRYIAATGQFKGWYGRTQVVPTGEDDACTSITGGAVTPTWCFGGSSQSPNTAGTGELNSPRGLATDNNYLYIMDTTYHRIVRIARNSGGFAGWLGRTGATPGAMTGFDGRGDVNCPNAAGSAFTGAWCAAGNTSASSNGNGEMNNPRGIAIDKDNGYIFVADTSAHRVSMYGTSGQHLGWLGRPSTVPGTAGPTTGMADTTCSSPALTTSLTTTNWCTGGASQSGNYTAIAFGGFNTPSGVSYANGEIYVADTSNNKIHKFTSLTGVYKGWIGRTMATKPIGEGPGSTLPAGVCTTALTAQNETPGWCIGGAAQVSGAGIYDNSFSGPTSVWADPSGTYFYVVDAGNERVTRHEKLTGKFAGWRGVASVVPTDGDTGCTTMAAGDPTPGWCKGGVSASSRKLGGFYIPVAITGDANFIYVTDAFNNRVVALPK
ncbi:MAG: hypothetical protein KF799_15450 [Bdellovibrionales bacterium]|nr:hypothetical protein [Bdellovibrionales bacterium]